MWFYLRFNDVFFSFFLVFTFPLYYYENSFLGWVPMSFSQMCCLLFTPHFSLLFGDSEMSVSTGLRYRLTLGQW